MFRAVIKREKLFQICACVISVRKAKHFDATTMFTYTLMQTRLSANYLGCFIKENITNLENRRKQEKTWENIAKISGKQVKDRKTGETRKNRQKQRKTGKQTKTQARQRSPCQAQLTTSIPRTTITRVD